MTIDAKLMQGNEACVEGALHAGMRFFAGYPITPSTEIAELCAERLPLEGGKFIQMEDEIASMAAIIGASLTGVKAMTATSGPGFSLKQENIGFASFAEIPCVIVNVQRGGPSTGLPTLPSQGDVMQAKWGTHGDHPVIVLCPSSVEETYHLTIKAFNLSEQYRIPVILLMDEIVGHMREKVTLSNPNDIEVITRKSPVLEKDESYLPYDNTKGDIPPLASFGSGYKFHITGLTHDVTGFPTNDSVITQELMNRLMGKIERNKSKLIDYRTKYLDDAETVVFSYGSTARSALSAVKLARERGIKVGWAKTNILWPFPKDLINEICSKAKKIIVPEMNFGQLVLEVERIVAGKIAVERTNKANGQLITPNEILDLIEEAE